MHEACLLAKRRASVAMFSGYGSKPQAVLSTVLLGREAGPPCDGVRYAPSTLSKAKHSLSAELMVALECSRGAGRVFHAHRNDRHKFARAYETKRKGTPEPQRPSYTIEEADAAGAPPRPGQATRPNWHKIRSRCSGPAASPRLLGSSTPTCWRGSTRRRSCGTRKTATDRREP